MQIRQGTYISCTPNESQLLFRAAMTALESQISILHRTATGVNSGIVERGPPASGLEDEVAKGVWKVFKYSIRMSGAMGTTPTINYL